MRLDNIGDALAGIRRLHVLGLVVLGLGYAVVALAAEPIAAGPDWTQMGMGLFGGLALFLFGMEQMSDGIKAVAGSQMKDLLARLTKNRVMGAITGAVVTAVIQSSSVTTVLVVGFVSAGLMTLTQSVGVIMGANVGTTVTAQIVAFKVTEAALAFIAIGFAMLFFGKTEKLRHYGAMLMGLGLIFFGMGIMSEAMSPLRSYQPFIDLMQRMENPLLGILVAAAFTALVQSSSATTGLIVVMASQGLITLPAGIAMALGANVGTCVTALLAAIGKPTQAVRAAVVHVVFNIAGALLWLGFIDQLAATAVWMSPASEGLTGTERLAADTPRQVANANTVFNIVNTIIFLPLAGVLARIVERLVPERPPEKVLVEPKFLDRELLTTPSLALERARLELGHMGEYVKEMYAALKPATAERDSTALESVAKADDKVDLLEEAIFKYLSKLRAQALSDEEAEYFQRLVNATGYMENIGDVIESEIVPLLQRYLVKEETPPSDTLREMLRGLYDAVGEALGQAVAAVEHDDQQAAQAVIVAKAEVISAIDEVLRYQAVRLAEVDEQALVVVRLDMEFLEKLRQVYTLTRRIAKEVLPPQIAQKAD